MSQYRNTVFNWFLSKKKPTELQFRNTWTWLRWRDEKIPIADVEGIDNLLLKKADAELVTVINQDVNQLKTDVKKGFKNGVDIQLMANTSTEYTLPKNAKLFAIQITGSGLVSMGTSSEALDNIADIDSIGDAILQTGFINNESVWFHSDKDVTITPIIYQK